MQIYAIQVASGQEAKAEEFIRRFVDESIIGEIFVPRFEAMRRWKGEWHKCTERLAPGYLFVETHDTEKLALHCAACRPLPSYLATTKYSFP